jgi:endo-1,4-beta-xylanase
MLAKACVAFTVWGLTDKYTWIDAFYHRQDMPLLFDSNYKPKPAFYAVRNALKTP